MIGSGSILKRAQRAAKRIGARGLILIYHRVAPRQNDPWRLAVTPENFSDHLSTLCTAGMRVVHVSQLAREVAEGRTIRGTVALTFDDGYADNLLEARPLLEQYGVPATLFATSGYIGSEDEFWWDTLERILLQPGELPAKLELDLADGPREWSLDRNATLTEAEVAQHETWKPFQEPPTARHRLHDELWSLLVSLEPVTRSRVVAQLLRWAELDSRARQSHRTLSKDELRRLARDELVEVGAHSVTHPGLGMMPKNIRRQELEGSKLQLEEMLGKQVLGFSYPQGRSSPEVQREAREAGFAFACGSIYEAVTARSRLFHLPRVSARDWDGARLLTLIQRHMVV
jgi:peptidoglycan/xylan/chitin deacetylase (PgdA/CDA1 family)